MDSTKRCRKCGEVKPLSDFHFLKGRQTYNSRCRDCANSDCLARYYRRKQGIPVVRPTPEERFWQHVDCSGGRFACWNWTGATDFGRYGRFSVNGRAVQAHRYSYEMHTGDTLGELQALHRCDNRRCVNPLHLFKGTQKDNMDDMWAKGRAVAGLDRSTKVDRQMVEDVRRLYWSGERFSVLAAQYGVCTTTIRRIVRGWPEIPRGQWPSLEDLADTFKDRPTSKR